MKRGDIRYVRRYDLEIEFLSNKTCTDGTQIFSLYYKSLVFDFKAHSNTIHFITNRSVGLHNKYIVFTV